MSEQTGKTAGCFLVAESEEARKALGGDEIEIRAFPFRVGRESRRPKITPTGIITERRKPGAHPNNDLYILETSDPMHVSREHFQIEIRGDGYALLDRQSTCGTTVAGRLVGGDNEGGRVALASGDLITAGGPESPFVFRFQVR